jgi:hypothetical protein
MTVGRIAGVFSEVKGRVARLGLVALSCTGVALGLSACGDRIAATRTFMSMPTRTFHFGPPGSRMAYEVLDGPLIAVNGSPSAGTRFYVSCWFKSGGSDNNYHCLGYVNTGHNKYEFTGTVPSLESATFNSLYAAGSPSRVSMGPHCCLTVNGQQNVSSVGITLEP